MKRFLSMVLTLALICTMLPTVFANEGEAAEAELELAYSYNFGAAGYDSTSAIDKDTLKTYGDTSEKPDASDKLIWATKNTDPWVIDGDYYTNTLELTAETVTGNKKPNALYWYAYGLRAWDDGVEKNNNAVAIRLVVDKVGTYIPKITYHARTENCMFEVYLIPLNKIDNGNKERIFFGSSSLIGTLCVSYAQQYIIGTVDMADDEEGTKTVELNAVEVTEETAGDYLLVLVTKGLNETLKAKYKGVDGPHIYANLYSLELFSEKKETLDSEFDYTEEEFIGGGATLRAFAVYGAGGEDSEEDIIETREITLGETVSVSAPVSVTRGDKTYNFLYWAKGATNKKQIVSYNASFTYKAYAEANNLIAVYKEAGAESSAKEYYNANGQLMDGDTLPSLPGYGQATGWADAGNGVYVAEYAPLQKNIKITVNGAEESYAYGDNVVCTANAPEGKVFMYWTKNDEIVSTESTYTFSAWETATVTAVYGDSAPTLGKTMRKILLGTLPAGEDTAVMAEFIGFSDAVEKGIIFG
ncbi:MAG: hypothetical protein E7473_02475, partial [Ruminococcaceae bacterium]|nr:hypothetical protein [Oscillospiraceae bacterium]